MTWLLVFLGGGLGAMARFGLAQLLAARLGADFPWATFTINVSGSLALGILVALVAARGAGPEWLLFLGTGFLGGYTTFSTYAVEGMRLLENGQTLAAVAYLGGSAALGLVAAFAGLALGRALG